MDFILNRLREPSTWSGFAALIGALGFGVPAGAVQAVSQIGIGIAGLAAIFIHEKTTPAA